LSTRQYARTVHRWAARAGLDSSAYGTHSLRRTKPAQIYKKTGSLRAVQLLLGHTKLESTVRYLGIELMTRSASRSRSNYSRAKVCGPAKSQGRSPIRVDRAAITLSLIRSLRDLAGGLPGEAELSGLRTFTQDFGAS
jgi:hypothetical protein